MCEYSSQIRVKISPWRSIFSAFSFILNHQLSAFFSIAKKKRINITCVRVCIVWIKRRLFNSIRRQFHTQFSIWPKCVHLVSMFITALLLTCSHEMNKIKCTFFFRLSNTKQYLLLIPKLCYQKYHTEMVWWLFDFGHLFWCTANQQNAIKYC